jgi:hypothetical protein
MGDLGGLMSAMMGERLARRAQARTETDEA